MTRRDRSGEIWLSSLLTIFAILTIWPALRHPELFIAYAAVGFLLATCAVWVWGYSVREENKSLREEIERRDLEEYERGAGSRTSNHTPEEMRAIADAILGTPRRLHIVEQRGKRVGPNVISIGDGSVPTQREPHHDALPADDWFARLYDDKGDLR